MIHERAPRASPFRTEWPRIVWGFSDAMLCVIVAFISSLVRGLGSLYAHANQMTMEQDLRAAALPPPARLRHELHHWQLPPRAHARRLRQAPRRARPPLRTENNPHGRHHARQAAPTSHLQGPLHQRHLAESRPVLRVGVWQRASIPRGAWPLAARDDRSSARLHEKLVGATESGLAVLLVFMVILGDPVMRWMID